MFLVPGSNRLSVSSRNEALTLSLFKKSATVLEDCLEPEKRTDLTRVDVPPVLGEGALFFPDASRRKPHWVDFLEKGFGREIGLMVGSASAVLLLRRTPGIVGLTWGAGGRFLLNRENLVEDFGLKVALNAVDPLLIRATDARTIDDASMYQRNQSSRQTSFDEFGFDASRAILQAVTGQPRDAAFAKMVTGSESLRITAQVDFDGLAAKADEVLGQYRSKGYKKSFPWVDSLKTVRDDAKIAELEEILVGKLREGHLDNCHLAPPEIIEWDHIEGFVYPGRRLKDAVPDLSLANCLFDLTKGKVGELELYKLKSAHIRVKRDDHEDLLKAWTVFKAMVAQVERAGHSYILSAGKWFEVEQSYVARVDEELSKVPLSKLPFPDAEPGWTETKYNEHAAAAVKGWILADRKNLKPTTAVSPIEVCDILTPKGEFIHVKKRRSSATLSHLFAQGTVSAQTLRGDAPFRDAVRELATKLNPIAAAQIPWGALESGKFDVIYAIISEKVQPIPKGLPFFAKVNLTHAMRVLRPLRCDVHLGHIKVAELP